MNSIVNFFVTLPSWSLYILSLLGTLLSGLIIYATKSYLSASKQFRNAIYTELEGLYPTPTKWPNDSLAIEPILKEKFSRLEIAVHNFKGHLPTCFVKGFNKTWIKYYSANGDERGQCYEHYTPSIGTSIVNDKQITVDTRNTYKKTFKHNVDNLLKYAK